MKYLCFAVVFLYAVFLHSAVAGDGQCVTPEQFKEGMTIAEQMMKDGAMNPDCEEYMVMEEDQEIAKKKMEDCLAKLKQKEPEEKEKIKECLKNTWETIIEKMKENPISKECFQEMMENCPFQNA